MLFWAVVSDSTEEAVELFTSREEAEAVVQAGTEMSRDKRGACASRRSSSRLRRTNQPAAAIVAIQRTRPQQRRGETSSTISAGGRIGVGLPTRSVRRPS